MSAAWPAPGPSHTPAGFPARPAARRRHPALDAGASLRDVQDLLRHADPRTTRRYDRARHSLDRHATYTLTAYLAD